MGRHTLAKMTDQRRRAIRGLLARGMTMAAIAQEMKCSPHTVSAVREMDAEPIQNEQRILARKWMNVAQLSVEQVQQRLADGEEASLKELTIVGAVASDKLLALKGEPTARILHERVESVAELKSVLVEALKAAQFKTAAVDVEGDEAPEAAKSTVKEGGAAASEAGGPARPTGDVSSGGGGGGRRSAAPLVTKRIPPEKKN